ncbi:spermidine synthase, partial [Georgenia sp. 10Sc9-8]|nr:spermidine synthase [Georgenia halotolerans]
LTPAGLYLVNLTDRPPLRQARAEVATVRAALEHVAVIVDPAILRGRRYGNVVVVASSAALPVPALDRAVRRLPLPARLLHGPELDTFTGAATAWQDAPDDEGPAPGGGAGPSR